MKNVKSKKQVQKEKRKKQRKVFLNSQLKRVITMGKKETQKLRSKSQQKDKIYFNNSKFPLNFFIS